MTKENQIELLKQFFVACKEMGKVGLMIGALKLSPQEETILSYVFSRLQQALPVLEQLLSSELSDEEHHQLFKDLGGEEAEKEFKEQTERNKMFREAEECLPLPADTVIH